MLSNNTTKRTFFYIQISISQMTKPVYKYDCTIKRSNGGVDLHLSVNADSDTKARLKALVIARTMKGTLVKIEKELAPFKLKDEKLNKLQEAMMLH